MSIFLCRTLRFGVRSLLKKQSIKISFCKNYETQTTYFSKINIRSNSENTHHYYYQCQGVLKTVGIEWMDFVLYTKDDLFCQRLHRDNDVWAPYI